MTATTLNGPLLDSGLSAETKHDIVWVGLSVRLF